MTRPTLSLLRVALDDNFGVTYLLKGGLKRRRRAWEAVTVGVSFAILIPMMLFVYVHFLSGIYEASETLGQPALILALTCLAGQSIVALFGLYWLVSAFYFSTDLARLVPLPLSPQAVLGSKFAQVAASALVTLLAIVGPALGVYAVKSGAGIGYWPVALLVFVLLPVIPLAAAGVIIVPAMRVVSVRRSRDILTVVGGLFGLTLAIGAQVMTAGLPQEKRAQYDYLRSLLNEHNGLLAMIGRRFPPAVWAARAMAERGTLAGWGQLALLVGVSAALLVAMLLLARRLFYRGLLSSGGAPARKSRLTTTELQSARATGAVAALAWRDWRLLTRTPVFMMQWLMTSLVVPIIFLMPEILGSEGGTITRETSGLPDSLLVMIGGGFLALATFMTQLAPTSISREGRAFWLNKVIPVAAADQMRARQKQLWQATLLSLLPALGMEAYILGSRAALLLPIAVLGLLAVYPVLNLGLLTDLLHPSLQWTEPRQAMKGNVNVMISMLLALALLAVVGGIAVLSRLLGLPGYAAVGLAGLLLLGAGVGLDAMLRGVADDRMRRIEM